MAKSGHAWLPPVLNHKVEKEEEYWLGCRLKPGYSSPNLPFPKLNIATQEGEQWVLLHPKGLLSQPKQRKKKRKDMGQDIRVRVVHTVHISPYNVETPFSD